MLIFTLSKCKMLEAEREQFEKEREELHETYDKQEKVKKLDITK